ncbi:hypothetical protein M408DRAFT_30334 [Serendipita vermifera MAFF 305830]|uniref:F-box domain-containing protein n=1 Tax=Serendipita vermifera MAFF 305830 TaxID=933852 RepID=A0A0C2W1S7_SERVB|nr:hypothetical protein M408DRAFT_30334 [Serendipita vermifera MAFF 305830]
MWAPVDLNALPTNKDYIHAKLAITQRERELADALLAPAQNQTRITNLEKDIYARRAWIAPIRKLGFDVLSLIFELCSKSEWSAPLKIGAISRSWRAVVLNTPRAWSIIDLRYLEDTDAVNTYLHRSGTYPIHARILNVSDALKHFPNILSRLLCVYINDTSGSENSVFPCLRWLTIRVHQPVHFFQTSRFPALRHLVYWSYAAIPETSTIFKHFPPLKTLKVNTMEGEYWNNMLKACSATLVALTLSDFCDSQYTCIIELPKLIFLRIYRADAAHASPSGWPLELVTPALQSYVEIYSEYSAYLGDGPIHKDLGTITHLRLSHMIPLSCCGQLRRLQIATTEDVLSLILVELATDNIICPDLEAIEVHLSHTASVDADTIALTTPEMTKLRERPFQITFHSRLRDDFPGFPVEECDSDMPCTWL